MSHNAPDPGALHFDALNRALRNTDTPMFIEGLDIVSVCQELVALTELATDPDECIRTQVAQSLLSDFLIAKNAQNLGPMSRAELKDPIKQLERTLSQNSDLRASQSAAKELLSALHVDHMTVLAWQDLVDVGKKSERFEKYCGLRDAFIAIAELNNRSPDSPDIASFTRGVLDDDAVSVALAKHMLGEDVPSWPRGGEAAALSQAERLSLCSRIWENPGRQACNIVWLSYEFATTPAPVIDKGSIKLISSESLHGVLHSGKQDFVAPSEVEEYRADFRRWMPPADHGQIVVRVDVGHGPIASAVEEAVKQVEALIHAAARTDRMGWRRVQNRVLQFADNKLLRFTSVRDGSRREPKDWRRSPVAMRLINGAPYERLPGALEEALVALGALSQDEDEPPQRRVVSRVELIERARLVTAGSHWADLASQFRPLWIIHDLTNRLFSTAMWLYHLSDDTVGGVEVFSVEAKRLAASFASGDNLGQYTHLDKVLANSHSLCGHLPRGWAPREELASSAKLVDSSGRAAAIERAGKRFDLLLERAKRCRNTAAHGWPVSSRAAASVVSMLSIVADNCVMIQLRAQDKHATAAFEMQGVVIDTERKMNRMRQGDLAWIYAG